MLELDDFTQLGNNTNKTFGNHDNWCSGSYPSRKFQFIAYLIIMDLSLAGNLLIVAIFFRDKTLRTTVNYFIVNMCVSDLIIPIVFLPIWITFNKNNTLLSVVGLSPAFQCKIIWTTFGVSVLVSWFSMTMLAADRFRAIIFPMKPSLFSEKKCKITIAGIWLSSIVILVYYTTEILVVNNSRSCTKIKWNSNSLSFLWTFLVLILLTIAVVTIFYSKVAIFLHRQKNSLHLASEVVKKRAKRNRKIITMLIIVVILFYAAWVPYCILMFSKFVFHAVIFPCSYVWFTSFYFIMMYPAINPTVYFVFNEKYRQGLKRILYCLWFCMKRAATNGRQENQAQIVGQVNKVVDNVQLYSYEQNK